MTIRRVKGGFKVTSHRTGRSFGTFKTRKAALRRLRQMKGHSKKS